jgi:hypothetical protein
LPEIISLLFAQEKPAGSLGSIVPKRKCGEVDNQAAENFSEAAEFNFRLSNSAVTLSTRKISR